MFGLGRIKLFTAFGIAVEAHWSLLLALLLFGLDNLGLAVLVFSSVLVHEFGHSLIARRLGVGIAGIELHFFGGVAKMTSLPRTPGDEIAIAIAGPVTSAALALLGGAGWVLAGSGFARELAVINTMLAVFNLLPALPMDGGRIFRAALQTRLGGYRATRIAVFVARGLAVALGVFGLVVGHYTLPVLAVLLWVMAGQEMAFAEHRFGRPVDRRAQVLPPEDAEPVTGPAVADLGAVQQMLLQVAMRNNRPGARQRVVLRDATGRIIVVGEGVIRW
ncbi:MAG: site-2 protease family protein [Pseudomonadota bacterium]